MITLPEAGKLGAVHTVYPGVLSLYVTVPLDPGEPPGLLARAVGLIAAAESAVSGRVAEEDGASVLEKLEAGGREWRGRTVAMFACADAGLFEVFPLPCRLPDRAVLGIRPHIRPLLAAIQRCPAYRVAIVDWRRAWLFHISGDEIEAVTAPVTASAPGPGRGPENYRVQRQIARLAGRHYRDTAALLEKVMADGEPEPLVIGGHDEGIQQLVASLPPGLRDHFAGSFTADTRTLTADRVRELAAPLVARWAGQRAERLAEQVTAAPPGGLAATGLPACLAAVNACAVRALIVPDEGLVPGYECGRCGDLSVDADECPDWGTAALPVPDLIEEMVVRTLEDGGEVYPVHGGLPRFAGRLRLGCRGATVRSGKFSFSGRY